jgi:6,7-dimethyl-8-ribityllumazine synthase
METTDEHGLTLCLPVFTRGSDKEKVMLHKEIKGKLDASGKQFAVVISRFNEFISKELLSGALDCLERHKASGVEVFWVPGSFEIPAVARSLAESKRYDAVITLGAVIRGETPHFDYVASEAAKGVARVHYETGVPTVFGIITADTVDQAINRAGTKSGNRGWNAALSAIELVDLKNQL